LSSSSIISVKTRVGPEKRHIYLEDNTPDERVDGGREDLAGALEAPEHDAALAEDGEEVEHADNPEKTVQIKSNSCWTIRRVVV
jgi:hypothetical protein